MRSLAAISLWLVPAVLMYLAYVLFRRLGTNRRSLERLFTEPADPTERPDGDSVVGGFLRRWLFLAGYRQPGCVCCVRCGDALGNGAGACRGVRHSRRRFDERIVQEHCSPPARRGRSPCPDCVPGALD